MKNRLLGFIALGFLLIAFVLAFAPVVRAQGVDDKIQALESELGRLKSEQMELKKEAVAAAAALPSFSYRPRSGVTIQAADRSWSIRQALLFQVHMYNHTDGNDARGATTGDQFDRRFRPLWTLCVSDCMYEWHVTLDFDTGDIGDVQNTGFYMNFSKINPWLPDLSVTNADSSTGYNQVARSSVSSAQVELASDLLADSAVSNLSRRQIGLAWLNKPLLITPGDFNFALEYRPGSGINRNVVSDTDRKEFAGILGARPYSRSKNPWLQRLRLGIATTVSSMDSRSARQGRRLRIRTDERVGRFTLLDTGGTTTTTTTVNTAGAGCPAACPVTTTTTVAGIGDGIHHNIQGGIEWGYGPYLSRVELGLSKFHSGKVNAASGPTAATSFRNVRGAYWRIGHELFLLSPKGPLTGSAYVPGTLQFGWGFERAQMNCGERAGTSSVDCYPGTGTVNNVRLLKRELDLWYYWNSFSRIGFFWNWWDADNVPQATQVAVGCSKNNTVRTGKDCDWHSVNLALQVNF